MKTEPAPLVLLQPAAGGSGSRAQAAIGLIAAFAALKLTLHFVATAITPYEIHRDEFLYLSMGEHLRFWCMDFPPAIAVLAKVARGLFGDTLFAIRFFPAVAGTLLLVFTALITRELGGGRLAQALAMLATLLGSLFLRPATLFQPVVLDQVCWTVGFYALARMVREPGGRWWLWLGVAGGLGLLAKFSILFFAFGVVVALLVSKQRPVLLARQPWMALGLGLVLGCGSIVGQLRLGLPVLVHMGDLQREQLTKVTYAGFLGGQVMLLGPALLLVVPGLLWLLFSRPGREFRVIGLTCLTVLLLLMLLHGKAYYIGPIYPTLFAAGAVWLAGLPGTTGRVAQASVAMALVVLGLVTLPFGLPILAPESMAQFCNKLGITAAVTTNRGTLLPLPQDYADMLGWEQQVQTVARVFLGLPGQQREAAGVLASNYGQAGALEFYGPRYGLPLRIMLPHDYHLWPADDRWQTVVSIGMRSTRLERIFRNVKLAERYDNPWRVEEERDVPIYIASEPLVPISTTWVQRKGWGK